MREFSMLVLGLFLFLMGFLGLVLSYSMERIGGRLFEMLDLNPEVTPSTMTAFVFIAISGILFISYAVGKGLGWRYRLFAFLGSVLCAISSAVFFAKLVGMGPDWMGKELFGIGDGAMTVISITVTLIPFLSFLGGFAALLSEMEI